MTKARRDFVDFDALYIEAKQLTPLINSVGDCLEVNVNPDASQLRERGYVDNIVFITRQVATNLWYVWRKK